MTSTLPLSGDWIRVFHRKEDAATRLICLPHAGGSATYFFPFSRAMPPSVEMLTVQYPGRQDRRAEPCITDLHQLADLTFESLLPWLDRPFALFGHSMGASLGFELARRLEQQGRSPLAVFASGRWAPSSFRDERVHEMADDDLIVDLKRLAGTDVRMLGDDDVIRMILPSLRADYTAAETYRARPGPPLATPIIALVGVDDPQVTVDEAAAWEAHTLGSFTLRTYPGGHFFLNDQIPSLVAEITAVMTQSLTH